METKKRLLQPHGEIVTIGQTFPSAERQTPPVAKNAFLADATAPLQPAEFPKRRDLFVLNRGRRNLTVCLRVNFPVVRYLIDRSSAWTSETIG